MKSSIGVLGALATIISVWWFALRPRQHKRRSRRGAPLVCVRGNSLAHPLTTPELRPRDHLVVRVVGGHVDAERGARDLSHRDHPKSALAGAVDGIGVDAGDHRFARWRGRRRPLEPPAMDPAQQLRHGLHGECAGDSGAHSSPLSFARLLPRRRRGALQLGVVGRVAVAAARPRRSGRGARRGVAVVGAVQSRSNHRTHLCGGRAGVRVGGTAAFLPTPLSFIFVLVVFSFVRTPASRASDTKVRFFAETIAGAKRAWHVKGCRNPIVGVAADRASWRARSSRSFPRWRSLPCTRERSAPPGSSRPKASGAVAAALTLPIVAKRTSRLAVLRGSMSALAGSLDRLRRSRRRWSCRRSRWWSSAARTWAP